MGYVGPEFRLTKSERRALEGWVRAPSSPQRLANRARVILASAEGESVRSISSRLEISQVSICAWRRRFLKDGLAGLQSLPRAGRGRILTEEQERRVVAATARKPADATHWSSRRLAKQLGMSQSAISRIWRKYGLQPHRVETFKFSTDPAFERKLADVVGLYLDPPEKALVLCVDEKSQIQALDRTQPVLPMRPGIPARMTHDYRRHGTTSLFAALEVSSGRITGKCYDRHTNEEFLAFLQLLDRKYPRRQLHLICDNYGTHNHPAVRAWLAEHPRIRLHFTPTSASWLNLVERWFARITSETIRRGTFSSVRRLEKAINAYIARWNEDPQPFVWTKSAAAIRRSVARAKAFADSRH